MPFTFYQTDIPGVRYLVPRLFSDDRGSFMETYKESDFIVITSYSIHYTKLYEVSAISVLVSTSKGAMLILVVVWLWLNVVNARRNRLRYIALTAVMVTAFYSINHRAIETKVDQYVELAKYVWTGMSYNFV